MFNLLMLNMIFLLILFFMLMINFLISKKDYKNREKISSFECGFDSICNNRLPFSLQFYLISVIFLIFDVEIALILPMVKLMNFNIVYFVFMSMIIMIILFVGLMIEFKEGALSWIK